MEFHGDTCTSTDIAALSGCTLLLPCVSVGNVGQLACDLLINSLDMRKLGHIFTECVLPIVGSHPFGSSQRDALTLSLELYYDKTKHLAVLQQRAPAVPGKLRQFAKELIAWISERNISRVIMLTSCHAYERLDDEIRGSSVRFISTKEKLKQELTAKNITVLRERKSVIGSASFVMPGCGVAKIFYDYCLEHDSNFDATIFMIYCSEGDNLPESLALLNTVNRWQNFKHQDCENQLIWKIPESWKHLFGSTAPRSIF